MEKIGRQNVNWYLNWFINQLTSNFSWIKIWLIFYHFILFSRSLRFFETGLHDFFSEAAVNFNVRLTVKFQNLIEESDPDIAESIYYLIKDQSKDVRNVTSLTIDELKSAFSLYGHSLYLCALILLFEGSIFFIDCLMRR
jgi:hypothetical protein